jgi:hypothetical protein
MEKKERRQKNSHQKLKISLGRPRYKWVDIKIDQKNSMSKWRLDSTDSCKAPLKMVIYLHVPLHQEIF